MKLLLERLAKDYLWRHGYETVPVNVMRPASLIVNGPFYVKRQPSGDFLVVPPWPNFTNVVAMRGAFVDLDPELNHWPLKEK